jgi:catechol 2,3-dioxygenase-like lactoylglutathione lyase family enzyme
LVEDQDKALKFYTEVLGFVKSKDIPLGEFRWLTVVSPQEPEGTELVLEPNNNPAAKAFQSAIHKQGISLTAFAVEDIQKEYERMKKLGVVFNMKPTKMGPETVAVFDDTCGLKKQSASIIISWLFLSCFRAISNHLSLGAAVAGRKFSIAHTS